MNFLTNEQKKEQVAVSIIKIMNGDLIEVGDASSSIIRLCIGDFREIGWAERITTRNSMYWYWTGPSAITLEGTMVKPNSYTEEIDMDWS